jgi:N-acetylmuramoyl-L-alanine amidase
VTGRWGLLSLFCALFALGIAGAAPVRAAPDALPVATDMRVGGDEALTRFVVDFSRKIDLRAFTLADPYRVIIDIPQVTFQLAPKAGEKGRGLIKAFRFGLVMQGGSRIVIDVAKPVRIEKAFVLDATAGQPARLVVDLAATDRESFLRNLTLENKSARTGAVKKPARDISSRIPADPRPMIVIDPGHGGIDTGTMAGGGETEKSIVLEFGLLLRDQIEKGGKYRVAMTRTDDHFIALAERVRFARDRKASLFVSIHADALPRAEGDVQGATVYTLSETASDAEAARLAETENRADAIAGFDLASEPDDVADILIDLAQRETKAFSLQFARGLVGEMKTSVRLHKNPLKSAGFRVLRAPDIPSVLVELGYVSNKRDLKLLTSGDWRARTADTMVKAIDAFFSTRLAGTAPAQERP